MPAEQEAAIRERLARYQLALGLIRACGGNQQSQIVAALGDYTADVAFLLAELEGKNGE